MAEPLKQAPTLRLGATATATARLLLLLMILGACGLPGHSAPPDVITPAAAVKVVRSYWTVQEQALATYNVDLLGKVQTTPLVEAQTADLKAAKAAGDPPLKAPRPLKKVTAYVPHQQHYPAQFVGAAETVNVDLSGNPTADLIAYYYRFTRASDREPWKADFYVLAPPNAAQQIALGADGFASVVSPSQGGLVLTPDQMPASLARYLQTGISTGAPEGPFAPGHLTTDAITSLRSYLDAMNKLGYTLEMAYAGDRYFAAYRGAGGRAVVLFDLESTDKIGVRDALRCIVQPQDDRHRWGGLVAPGSYSQLVESRQLQFIAVDPVKKGGSPVDVPAYVETEVSAETSPADPACH